PCPTTPAPGPNAPAQLPARPEKTLTRIDVLPARSAAADGPAGSVCPGDEDVPEASHDRCQRLQRHIPTPGCLDGIDLVRRNGLVLCEVPPHQLAHFLAGRLGFLDFDDLTEARPEPVRAQIFRGEARVQLPSDHLGDALSDLVPDAQEHRLSGTAS